MHVHPGIFLGRVLSIRVFSANGHYGLIVGTLRSTTRWVDENAMKQQYHWLKEEK